MMCGNRYCPEIFHVKSGFRKVRKSVDRDKSHWTGRKFGGKNKKDSVCLCVLTLLIGIKLNPSVKEEELSTKEKKNALTHAQDLKAVQLLSRVEVHYPA